jgi:hypothetical protein
VFLRNAVGRVTFSTGEAQAASAIDRAFATAATRPRITRMYAYQWIARAGDRFDAGLARPDGVLRPSYAALQRGLAGARTAAATAPALRWRATWSRAHPRRLVLRATCRKAAVRCAGTVSATLRTRAAGGAAAAFARLARGRAYRTTTAKATITVRLTVSRAAWQRARRARTRRVAVTVAATRPAKARVRSTVALARPR